jgi:phage-related protein
MDSDVKLLVVFYATESGKEPVRDWLKSLTQDEKKQIGEDIKTVQFGWPLGMPLIRKLDHNLWEVRSKLLDRTARVIFTVENGYMVLLHGFIKKSQKIPQTELKLAKERLAKLRGD